MTTYPEPRAVCTLLHASSPPPRTACPPCPPHLFSFYCQPPRMLPVTGQAQRIARTQAGGRHALVSGHIGSGGDSESLPMALALLAGVAMRRAGSGG